MLRCWCGGSLGRCGGVGLGLGLVRRCGRLCLAGGRLGGLGGQEHHGQQGPGRGHAAGDESADGQAAQERVGGGVLQGLSEDWVAEGREPAGGSRTMNAASRTAEPANPATLRPAVHP